MEKKLKGKKVAVLVDNGFEQIEMTEPIKALKEHGANVFIVSKEKKVKGWNHVEWGDEFHTDILLEKAIPTEFDALLLPGGVMNPDKLRADENAVAFVKYFTESGKPIAAICHGPWTLIETGIVNGRKMTSYHSIKSDLINAGANWIDQEVVTDQGLVTSRKPDDIPAFNKKMIEEFAEGVHKNRTITPLKRERNIGFQTNKTRLNENIDDRHSYQEDSLSPSEEF